MPETLIVDTPGRGLIEITAEIADLTRKAAPVSGIVQLFLQHTSASLVIQENADPDVQHDLVNWFDRAAPEDGPYRHSAEGPDDMPAHIKTALTAVSLAIPFAEGRLLLGTWQGIYLFEHRRAAAAARHHEFSRGVVNSRTVLSGGRPRSTGRVRSR